MTLDDALRGWMLDTDPALRWQVERDLLHEPADVWQATKKKVATEGFGAQLLAKQDADGQWAGGAYYPSDFSEEEYERTGQPWTATTYSLKALREWGVDASAMGDTAEKLAANSRWDYNDGPYWEGEADACINGFTLAAGAWLGADVSRIADWFLEHRMTDGGWNCEWEEGSVRSSFDSTLNSLTGLLAYEVATGGTPELRAARTSGEEYLLERRLMRRLSTGKVADESYLRFGYPVRWQYNVLSAADYFRSAAMHDGTAPDPRIADAIDVIRAARQPDGSWLQQNTRTGRVWFEVDVPDGERSPWITLFGTRVLDWWG